MDQFIRDIQRFLYGLNSKGELDILVELIFNFNLHQRLEDLSKDLIGVDSINCSIAYIDKRPKIDFYPPYLPIRIEVGDALFIFNKLSTDVNTSKSASWGKAYFIQAKKQEGPLKLRGNSELKQHHLYQHWPPFRLYRPRTLGRLVKDQLISFQPINSNNSNPGLFLKLSESSIPSFHPPHDLGTIISFKDFMYSVFQPNEGRSFYQQDQFSEFVSEVFKSSIDSTFKRATVFPGQRRGRVAGNPFFMFLMNCGGYIKWPNKKRRTLISERKIRSNLVKLITSAAKRKITSRFIKNERPFWVITLEVKSSEENLIVR